MKKMSFLLLLFLGVQGLAQRTQHTNSIYYLLDTANTPKNDRMWKSSSDGQYKNFALQCPCLENHGKPTFFYNVENKDNVTLINKKQLKIIKLASLDSLIAFSKLIEHNIYERNFSIFFIEPKNGGYTIRDMSFMNPGIQVYTPPDVLPPKHDNSAFEVKGLIEVDSKSLDKYINKSVITVGKVVNFRIVEADKLETLLIGADYPNQDFTIIIRGKNLSNFNAIAFYKGRRLRVVGKVIEYEGKPAIELSNEGEIQHLPRIKTQP
jgi:hypothetical protein